MDMRAAILSYMQVLCFLVTYIYRCMSECFCRFWCRCFNYSHPGTLLYNLSARSLTCALDPITDLDVCLWPDHRPWHMSVTLQVQTQLQYAVSDELVDAYLTVSFKGARTGLEQEGYRMPEADPDCVTVSLFTETIDHLVQDSTLHCTFRSGTDFHFSTDTHNWHCRRFAYFSVVMFPALILHHTITDVCNPFCF